MRPLRRPDIALVALLLLCSQASAMIEDLGLQFGREDLFQIIWRFEFAEKGELSIDGQTMVNSMPTNSSVQMMLCSDSSLVKLRTIRIEDICARKPFDAAPCEWSSMFTQDISDFNVNLDIKSEDWYYLLQLNCDRLNFYVQAHIVAYNRGRYTGFLSLSEAPYVPLSVALAVVFTLLTLSQFLSWFPYRHFNVKFQSRLTLIPLFFAVFYTIQIYHWDYCSKHGVKSQLAFWSCFVFLIITKSILFMLLLAVSKGWAICRKHLSSLDFKQSLLLILGMILAFSCFTILGGMGLSTMILIYAMLLKVIFNSVVNILAEIDNQMQMLRSMNMDPNHFPIFVKRQIYHNFQLSALSYITLKVIFLLWANIFLQRFPWVSDMIDAFLDMAFLVSLFIIFRMRPFCPRFATAFRTDDNNQSDLSRHLLRSNFLADQDMEVGQGYEDIWRPGMAVPVLSLDYDSWLHPYSEPLILLQSADSVDIGRQLSGRPESKAQIR